MMIAEMKHQWWFRLLAALQVALLVNLTSACGGEGSKLNLDPAGPGSTPAPEYHPGEVLHAESDANGTMAIQTASLSADTTFTFVITVVDESGAPIQGAIIDYYEWNGLPVIYGSDPRDEHTGALLYGPPLNLRDHFGSGDSDPISDRPLHPIVKISESQNDELFLLTIGILFTLTTLTIAQLEIIEGVYRIQTIYLADIVAAGDGYIKSCKSLAEIADLLDARTQVALGLVEIFLAYASFVGGVLIPLEDGLHIILDKTVDDVFDFSDAVLTGAYEAWGIEADRLVAGEEVGFVVYLVDEEDFASDFTNLFAAYEIGLDDPLCSLASGTVLGRITDAETGDGIDNATVSIHTNPVRTATTNQSGDYRISGLSPGNYTLEAKSAGYISITRHVDVTESALEVNLSLSRHLGEAEYRIVLSWGSSPQDLDLHGWIAGIEVYWYSEGSEYDWPYMSLDRDDRDGYGPETITVARFIEDTYEFAVHRFSGDGSLSTSNAHIDIYHGVSQVLDLDVPPSGSGRWWHVCKILSDGDVSTINILDDDPPQGVAPLTEEIKGKRGKRPTGHW